MLYGWRRISAKTRRRGRKNGLHGSWRSSARKRQMRWKREESRVNRLPRSKTILTNSDPSLPLFALPKPPFALLPPQPYLLGPLRPLPLSLHSPKPRRLSRLNPLLEPPAESPKLHQNFRFPSKELRPPDFPLSLHALCRQRHCTPRSLVLRSTPSNSRLIPPSLLPCTRYLRPRPRRLQDPCKVRSPRSYLQRLHCRIVMNRLARHTVVQTGVSEVVLRTERFDVVAFHFLFSPSFDSSLFQCPLLVMSP
jgi:hypothetical protein